MLKKMSLMIVLNGSLYAMQQDKYEQIKKSNIEIFKEAVALQHPNATEQEQQKLVDELTCIWEKTRAVHLAYNCQQHLPEKDKSLVLLAEKARNN